MNVNEKVFTVDYFYNIHEGIIEWINPGKLVAILGIPADKPTEFKLVNVKDLYDLYETAFISVTSKMAKEQQNLNDTYTKVMENFKEYKTKISKSK